MHGQVPRLRSCNVCVVDAYSYLEEKYGAVSWAQSPGKHGESWAHHSLTHDERCTEDARHGGPEDLAREVP
jgi:hypothetical protein